MKARLFGAASVYGLVLVSVSVNAALHERGNGTMLYDDVLDITWLKDANYILTKPGIAEGLVGSRGTLGWTDVQLWVDNLRFRGYDDWRLPSFTTEDISYNWKNNGTGTSGYGATGSGYGTSNPTGGWGTPSDPDSTWSELGWMWYHNLGNTGFCTPNDSDPDSCVEQSIVINSSTPDGVTVENLQTRGLYWTSFPQASSRPGRGFGSDGRSDYFEHSERHIWPVLDGDVAVIPIPAALPLFGSALGLFGFVSWMRWKAA